MKTYIYRINNFIYTSDVCFGEAWHQAYAKAKEIHAPIYRTTVTVSEDVYCRGGCFLGVEHAEQKQIETFEEASE